MLCHIWHAAPWHQICPNIYEEKSDQGGLMSGKERYVWVWQWKSKWTWKFDLVCQIREQLRCERALTISLTSKPIISILTKKKRKWVSCVTNKISFKGQWRPFYVQSNKSMLKNLQSRTIVLPTPASCTFAKKECDVSHPICQIYFPSEFDKRCLCAAFPAHVVDLAANSIGNPELCRSFCFKGSPAP